MPRLSCQPLRLCRLQNHEPCLEFTPDTGLFAKERVIRVQSESAPGDGFEPSEAGLEDVYFWKLARGRREV